MSGNIRVKTTPRTFGYYLNVWGVSKDIMDRIPAAVCAMEPWKGWRLLTAEVIQDVTASILAKGPTEALMSIEEYNHIRALHTWLKVGMTATGGMLAKASPFNRVRCYEPETKEN